MIIILVRHILLYNIKIENYIYYYIVNNNIMDVKMLVKIISLPNDDVNELKIKYEFNDIDSQESKDFKKTDDYIIFYDLEDDTYNNIKFYWSEKYNCYKTKEHFIIGTNAIKWISFAKIIEKL